MVVILLDGGFMHLMYVHDSIYELVSFIDYDVQEDRCSAVRGSQRATEDEELIPYCRRYNPHQNH